MTAEMCRRARVENAQNIAKLPEHRRSVAALENLAVAAWEIAAQLAEKNERLEKNQELYNRLGALLPSL